MWLHECGVLGASPDGLVEDNSVVEAKCPYTQRNLTIEEAIATNNFGLEKKELKDFTEARPCLLAPSARPDLHY